MLSDIHSPGDLKKIPQEKLSLLCEEIRERIISVMAKNGGHLASNLGTVELIVALHYVFNSPDDKIIYDVGHQCYTHKLLTGRNSQFDTIRNKKGLSGFTRRKESPHDLVDAGHSSTSISQAIGFAVANKLRKNNHKVLAMIGDGALTGGVAFEGLNFTGNQNLPVVIILNDNEMSISKNVGAFSNYINKFTVSKFYQEVSTIYEENMNKLPQPFKAILNFIYRLKRGLKFIVEYENVFTSLGFEYLGPIDGHNLDELIYIFERVLKNVNRPVLLHVKTVKGKGYTEAEGNPAEYHGVTPALMCKPLNTSALTPEEKKNITFTDVFGTKVAEMGEKYKNLLTITAAMEKGTGLYCFKEKFPDRFYDIGIAEQHAVTFAASLAYDGFKPVFAVYSTFLMRGIDQICQDICISSAPVILAVDRAGIVGKDGETHQGQFDVSFLRMLPNLEILAPCDATELSLMLEYAYLQKHPVVIRYPRDHAEHSQLNNIHPDITHQPYIQAKKGSDILIAVTGPFVSLAREAALEIEKEHNVTIGIIYIRRLKPIEESLIDHMEHYRGVLTIEENTLNGSVSEYLGSQLSKKAERPQTDYITLPDSFIEHDTRQSILKELGFTKENIKKRLKLLIEKSMYMKKTRSSYPAG